MSDIVISAENVSKQYLIGHQSVQRERYKSLRDIIGRETRNFIRRAADLLVGRQVIQGDEIEELWALRNVSFEVKAGEVVGIIGRNGAGKSTLLKILSRITEPTEGRVTLRGRVGSLLEVGTGFHPELTGRENIFLNGAILGMTQRDIRKKFDKIVDFAEVEKFIDTPVKRYSTGMYVRLAFSVAAHLETEILIVDEVLAVGDVEFQKKCLGMMKSVARKENRTVLFVSHNMAAVQSLCNQILLLQGGTVVEKGDTEHLIEHYLKGSSETSHSSQSNRRQLSHSLTLETLNFAPNPVESGGSCVFEVEFSSIDSAQMRELAILIYAGLGTRVAILDLRQNHVNNRVQAGGSLKLRGRIHSLPLVEGDYSVGLWINCGEFSEDVYDVAKLSVGVAGTVADVAPYPPSDRGLLELSFEFYRD